MAIKTTKPKKRTQIPRRYRDIPAHASIDAARQAVADTLGLPIDSIKLVLPSGRKANYNATVETLRQWWADEQ